MQFGLSDFFNPAPAAVGGALLGFCVMYKATLTGDILGVSAATRGVLAKGPTPRRVLFLLGLLLAGVAGALAGDFGLEPALPTAAKAELWVRMGLGGFLVGFGTSLGNGCTSGHGLTGLARLGFRSWFGVPNFMFFAVATATLTGTARVLPPHPSAENDSPSWELGAAVAAAAVLLLVLSGGVFVALRRQGLDTGRLKDASELFSGSLFGLGLLISGMGRPSKVAGFLDLGSGAWDPSLMFVMGGALALTFPFYQLLQPLGAGSFRLSEPLLGGDWSEFPSTRAWPNRDIALGTACFGLGWGLTGTCPGPMWVLLGARPSLPLLLFVAGVYCGVGTWMQYKKRMQAATPAAAPKDVEVGAPDQVSTFKGSPPSGDDSTEVTSTADADVSHE